MQQQNIDKKNLLKTIWFLLNFQAEQFHFHWGSVLGSEHALNGKKYFGEMHIVHRDKSLYNLTMGLGQRNGVAVLGFFVEVSVLFKKQLWFII